MKNIFVILGKSGCGKSTLVNSVCQQLGISNVVATTTRPIRQGELDGIDYYFVTDEEFQKGIQNNDFVQYSKFKTWFYGIETYSLNICCNDNLIIILNPKSYEMFSKNVSKELYNIIPVFIQCNDRIRLQRILNRDTDVDEVVRRYSADKIDFEGIEKKVIDQGGFIIDNSFESIDYALSTLCLTIERYNGKVFK